IGRRQRDVEEIRCHERVAVASLLVGERERAYLSAVGTAVVVGVGVSGIGVVRERRLANVSEGIGVTVRLVPVVIGRTVVRGVGHKIDVGVRQRVRREE